MQVPQQYSILGYSSHSVASASSGYVPPNLVRSLRVGAEVNNLCDLWSCSKLNHWPPLFSRVFPCSKNLTAVLRQLTTVLSRVVVLFVCIVWDRTETLWYVAARWPSVTIRQNFKLNILKEHNLCTFLWKPSKDIDLPEPTSFPGSFLSREREEPGNEVVPEPEVTIQITDVGINRIYSSSGPERFKNPKAFWCLQVLCS